MTASFSEHEARLVELEMRLAFQDQTIATLNEAVVEQSRALDELGRRLQHALDDLARMRTLQSADPAEEPPPPHY